MVIAHKIARVPSLRLTQGEGEGGMKNMVS